MYLYINICDIHIYVYVHFMKIHYLCASLNPYIFSVNLKLTMQKFFYPLIQLFLSHVEYEKHTEFLAENND